MYSSSINKKSLIRSNFNNRNLHLVLGNTCGILTDAEGPFFFLRLTERGAGAGFFFLLSGFSSPGGPSIYHFT
jgi:hypothetical protein